MASSGDFDLHGQFNVEEYEDPRESMVHKMRMFVMGLRDLANKDIHQASRLVYLYLCQPIVMFDDIQFRQKFGDHVAHLRVAKKLHDMFQMLMSKYYRDKSDWESIHILLLTCMNTSDFCLKFCSQMGQCGFIRELLNSVMYYHHSYTRNKNSHMIVAYSLNILQNCAKASDNKYVYRDLSAVERITPFLQSEDIDVAATALLTLSYITEEHEPHLLKADERIIKYLTLILKGAIDDDRLRYKGFSAMEIVVGIGNIAINDDNKIRLINNSLVSLLLKLMQKGLPIEQKCALYTLLVLAKLKIARMKIVEDTGTMPMLSSLAKNGNPSVKQAAERVLMLLKPPMALQDGKDVKTKQPSTKTCDYRRLCEHFKDSLGLPGAYFNPTYDICYCNTCHIGRKDNLYYSRGQSPKDYGIPIGWCRFALQVSGRVISMEVFKKWHVAFHGTHLDAVRPILQCGDLLMPGDVAMGGKKLSEREGHFNDERKPENFDTKQVFLSPSIRYSGHNIYAHPSRFKDKVTKKVYSVKVVFQVVVNPNSYTVGPETIGAKERIDPKFSNQELEWFTKQRGSIIIYGLLVNMK